VHGLLPAGVPRRILALAAAAVVPAAVTAVLGLAAPAQAQTGQTGQPGQTAQAGRVSVAIDSMTPQTAKPGSTVTVAGTVTNRTGQTKAGLEVQLLTSPSRFATRDEMDGYVNQGTGASLLPAGRPYSLTASLRPGGTVQWHASFQVSTVGMAQFGVYPVTAQLADGAGDVLGLDQTLLPFWPGQQAAGLERPLDVAWTWPLIDQPHHQVCTALTSNDLVASLTPGGRLSALLGAGQAYPGAHLTWVIDPALLADVNTMTKPYQVASGTGCSDAVNKPASKAAKTWLGTLRGITAAQPPVITPYANVDVSALVDSGLAPDITSAYSTGYAVAGSVLHGSFGPSIAVPAGGTADLSVLTNLATVQHIGAAVLDSSQMPPANPSVFEPDDAITTIRTPAGVNMTILLADHTLTGVLAAGDTSSGVLPLSTQFAVSQRFLAETAMIAAEAPDSDRSIVVAPPENWSPSAALASHLLSETTSTPWLAPTALGSLAGAPDSDRGIVRQNPPAKASPGELTSSYLNTVAQTDAALGVYRDLLYGASNAYVQGLEQALTATESSAWRGRAAPQGLALAGKLSRFMSGEESRIKIIAAQQVPMGGSSGLIPVSIQNDSQHAIRVRLNTGVVDVPDRPSQLTVGHFQSLITIQPQQAPTVRLPVSSAPIGPTAIQLTLTTVHGLALPLRPTSLTVQSTRYGRAILFLVGAAIGVLVLTSIFRGFRRRMRADRQVAPEDGDLPGSVETGTSARHPTEAPDDLADARRWADDA
jgi:hypothetical protein